MSLLHRAVSSGDVKQVTKVLNGGVDINTMYLYLGELAPALHLAIEHVSIEVMELLIMRGADIDAAGWNSGWTALHRSVSRIHKQHITRFLLQHKANIHARTMDGDTPLHVAAWNREPSCIKILMEHNADTTKRDASGKTPWDLVNCCGVESLRSECLNLLTQSHIQLQMQTI